MPSSTADNKAGADLQSLVISLARRKALPQSN
jgi:hypothetical protein